MSIKSTQRISRDAAIERLETVSALVARRNYREIERISYDPNCDIRDFVERTNPFGVCQVGLWTNEMLEDELDKPFFRWSMFDNYLIDEGDCS